MHIYDWELLAACQHPEKFDDHRHSDGYEEKCCIKNANLTNMYYHEKIELTGYPLGKKKCYNFKNVHFEKKCQKNLKTYFCPITLVLR